MAWWGKRLFGRRWLARPFARRPRAVHGVSVLRVVARDGTCVDRAALGGGGSTWQVGDSQVYVPAGAVRVVLAPADGSEVKRVVAS